MRDSPGNKSVRLGRWRVRATIGVALTLLILLGVVGYTLLFSPGQGIPPKHTVEQAEQASIKVEQERQAREAAEAEAKRRAEEAEQQRLAAARAEQERQARGAAEAEAMRKADEGAVLKAEQERQAGAAKKAKPESKEPAKPRLPPILSVPSGGGGGGVSSGGALPQPQAS